MSIAKQRHVCDRCGFEWTERTSGIYDELAEWIAHATETERDLRCQLARAQMKIGHLENSLEVESTLAKNFQTIADRWQRMFEEQQEEALPF